MSGAKRFLLVSGLLAFLVAIALRPLSNPALTGVLDDSSLGTTDLLLLVPTLLVAVLVVTARLWRLFGDDSGDAQTHTTSQPTRGNHWGVEDADERTHADEDAPDAVSQILGGQGGARDRQFEIERESPEADLSDHLDHLQAELDDEAQVELETLEEVVEETENGSQIPKRCPHPTCDAAWTERGILDIKNGRYEPLDDGQRVQCLDCEAVVELD
jgi:hypothetical protein